MKYIDKPYFERRFLMVADDDRGTANDAIDIFRRAELPQGVNFGNNRVQKNVLYIAHPGKKGLYIPFDGYEMAYFNDKIHELTYLLQALGAEKITINWVKGQKLKDFEESTSNIGASVDAGVAGGSVNASNQSNSTKMESKKSEISLTLTNSPILPPFVPDDLHWLEHEPSWEMMIKQRMVGTKTYELQVSSQSQQSLNESEAESLKVALRYLKVKIGFEYDSTVKRINEREDETIWKVFVEFKPLDQFSPSSGSVNKSNEITRHNSDSVANRPSETLCHNSLEEYRNSCIALIKSYNVSDNIQIELNRLRKEYNISPEEAEGIEKEIKSQFKKNWFSRLFGNK